jgi:UDP-2,3-diacylglucosamine hydrolase
MSLGRWVSKFSRRNNASMSDEILLDFAKEKLSEGFDYVILAHTHSPFVHREDEKLYLNVGDWMVNFTYAEMNSEGLELRQFEV